MKNEYKEIEKEILSWRKTYSSLNELVKARRINEQFTTLEMSIAAKMTEDEYINFEKGEVQISKEELTGLLKPLGLPKKLLSTVDPKRPPYAKRIIELRIQNGRTQEETSKTLDIPLTTYSGYETGRREPDINTLIKIANLYNVSLDYLTGRY
jgi:transcriptional regulator with XRE-family HTH domain